jgi:hypothetical protein
MREKGILLRLVEAMDLIHKKNRPLTVSRPALLGCLDEHAQFRHAACHSRKGNKLRLGMSGNEMGQGRLPRPRRSPKNDGRKPVGFNRSSQGTIRTDKLLLPDEINKLTRPHPLGKRGLNRILKAFG